MPREIRSMLLGHGIITGLCLAHQMKTKIVERRLMLTDTPAALSLPVGKRDESSRDLRPV